NIKELSTQYKIPCLYLPPRLPYLRMQLDYYLKQLNELFLVYYLLVCINMGEQSFLYPYAEAKGMPNELFSYLDDIFQSLDPTLIHPGDEVYIISCTMLFGSYVFPLAILLL